MKLSLVLFCLPTLAFADTAKPTLAVEPSWLDTSISPCDNFYEYACGAWEKKTEIPPDRPRWDTFTELADRSLSLLRSIVEADAKNPVAAADDPYAKKLGEFYATCMDEPKAETASLKALQEELHKIDALKDKPALAALTAGLQLRGVDVLFDFDSEQDFKDSTQMIAVASQAGLGLPDRDYYFKDDAKTADIRKLYLAHIGKYFELAKLKDKQPAEMVMKLETALAKASLTRTERRDPYKVYHRLERAGLIEKAPHFDWAKFYAVVGVGSDALNVAEPEFFAAMNAVVDQTPLTDLKTYLRWHLLETFAPTLGKAFVDEDFAFRSKALTGAKENLPRWKRCVMATDAALGEALAEPFVNRYFGALGKSEALSLITGIERAFSENLAQLSWMDEATKKAAGVKLAKVFNMIGYPDKWRNYDALAISQDSYLKNAALAAEFEAKRRLARIGKPVDRSEWHMTPPTVNAYYNPSLNEMVFPAGILQPRFFQPGAPRPMNYGAIGMVMGHELTHGFDDHGRQFDGDGNLRDWWSEPVGKAFDERAACVTKQYDGYIAVGDQHVNGKLTLGENIADNGGIKIAYSAFSVAEKEKPSAVVANFTPAQQFFLGYAQAWCSKRREEYSRMLANVDPHSPPLHRVNGPLRNLPAFSEAFQCKAGSDMAPQDRCTVW